MGCGCSESHADQMDVQSGGSLFKLMKSASMNKGSKGSYLKKPKKSKSSTKSLSSSDKGDFCAPYKTQIMDAMKEHTSGKAIPSMVNRLFEQMSHSYDNRSYLQKKMTAVFKYKLPLSEVNKKSRDELIKMLRK